MAKFEVRFFDKEKGEIGTIDVYDESIEEAEETFRMNRNLELLSIMEVKQRKAKVKFKDKMLIINITDYESSIIPALVERIKKEYKTDDFIITDIIY